MPENDHEKKKCCCPDRGPKGDTGAKGEPGPAGPRGLQGSPGAPGQPGQPGQNGAAGQTGAEGPPGQTGAQGQAGPAGPEGPSGKCEASECECDYGYLNMYSSVRQTMPPNGIGGDTVTFDKTNGSFDASIFDTSQAAALGEVKFLKKGDYRLSWFANGKIAAPLVEPVPSWGLGFYLNNVFVPGSASSGFNDSPNDDASHTSAEVIITIQAGDVLKLKNVSLSILDLNPTVNGTVVPITAVGFLAELEQFL